jgi:hypothetical protein
MHSEIPELSELESRSCKEQAMQGPSGSKPERGSSGTGEQASGSTEDLAYSKICLP